MRTSDVSGEPPTRGARRDRPRRKRVDRL